MDDRGAGIRLSPHHKGRCSQPARHRLRQCESVAANKMPAARGHLHLRVIRNSRRNATRLFSICLRCPEPAHGLRESFLEHPVRGAAYPRVREAPSPRRWRARRGRRLGLRLCAKEPKWYSNTVSAVMVPHGIDGADVIDAAFRRYNLALGAGLSKVSGKLFRIGHLGDSTI